MNERYKRVLQGLFIALTVLGLLITGALGYPMVQTAYNDWQLERTWDSEPRYRVAAAIEEACPYIFVVDITTTEWQDGTGGLLYSTAEAYLYVIPDVFAALSEEEQSVATSVVMTAIIEAIEKYIGPDVIQLWFVDVKTVKTMEGEGHVAKCYYGLQGDRDEMLDWLANGCTQEELTRAIERRSIQYYVGGFWARPIYHYAVLERPSYTIAPYCDTCPNIK